MSYSARLARIEKRIQARAPRDTPQSGRDLWRALAIATGSDEPMPDWDERTWLDYSRNRIRRFREAWDRLDAEPRQSG